MAERPLAGQKGSVPVFALIEDSPEFSCSRCGVVIQHPTDLDLVHRVAAQHIVTEHAQPQLGEYEVRWTRPMPAEVVDRAMDACTRAFPGQIDYWADELRFEWSLVDGSVTTEMVLAVIGPVVDFQFELRRVDG